MISWPPRPDDEPIDWGDEPVEPPPPPYAARSIRLALSAAYDYAGSSIAASLIAFLVYYTALAIFFGAWLQVSAGNRQAGIRIIGLLVLLGPLVIGPFTAGLYNLAHGIFTREDPRLLDIWRGAVRNARSAWALAYAQTFISTILISDVVFLMRQPGLPLKLIAVIISYALLFWLMMLTYQWPLFVEQGKPLKTTLLRSLVLAAHNPLYTLAILAVVLVLIAVPMYLFLTYRWGPASLVPVSMLWGAIITCLHTSATLEILRKYPDPH